ncbi:MAG: 3-oxoacyl-ACP reductase family protein [Bryobacteraceae bacterium]
MLLQDKVALVTGSGTGIGEAIARRFAEEGARMYLFDRDAESNRRVAESIAASGGWAEAITGDVRRAADLAALVEAAHARFGRIDILVNNAGIYPRRPFLEITDEQWDEMQDINLKSMFRASQLALKPMMEARAGKIVNISSVTYFLGVGNLAHYTASKGGVIGLTRSLARAAGACNVHVNCVTPGFIQTESEVRFVSQEEARKMVADQCLARRITPLDVARVCLFLSSELSDGMTGQCLNVDGGWVMH